MAGWLLAILETIVLDWVNYYDYPKFGLLPYKLTKSDAFISVSVYEAVHHGACKSPETIILSKLRGKIIIGNT